ncbi:MAG: OmpA family protein [Anaeromyxobacter sp.]
MKARLEGKKIVILEQVHFATNKDIILDESAELLRQVARILAEHPEIAKVRVEGHTDTQGTAAKNLDLSNRRAAKVRDRLVQEGIDAARLAPQGFGQKRPIATNDTVEGRARNRRVEFVIVE